MKVRTVLTAAVVALFGLAPSLASASPGDTPRTDTPNSCIARNQGDWNACNVGNSGSGAAPYKPFSAQAECIRLNQGDWTACNVGNNR
ncbi:MAG: hypothetical protein QOI76_2291 [Frankiales bacterium]|jgi:hypothetical protein|nr:hypothetical protein [Frankiales bacterium]